MKVLFVIRPATEKKINKNPKSFTWQVKCNTWFRSKMMDWFVFFVLVLRPFLCLPFHRCRLQKQWTRLIWRITLSHTPLQSSLAPWETCSSFLPMTLRLCTPPENVGRLCQLFLKRGRRRQGSTLPKGVSCSAFENLQGWSLEFLSVMRLKWKSARLPL